MTRPAELAAYLFEGRPHPLSAPLTAWMEASPRFTVFVETYRDKIRKKIRVTRQPESILDLRGELEVACSLLNDRRFSVAYEPYASTRRRGPDFTVTYRANLVFNVEVTRLRPEAGLDGRRVEERFLRLLLGKLGQMQPAMPNLLAVHAVEDLARSLDLPALMQGLKTRVDKKDPTFFALTGYSNPAAFYKDFLRLSAILLWSPAVQFWINKQARPALPAPLLHLLPSLPQQAPMQKESHK